MKTQTPKNRLSKYIILSIIAILLSAGAVFWIVYGTTGNNDSSSSQPTTEEQEAEAKQAAEDKQKFLDNEVSGNGTSETTTPDVNEDSLLLTASQTDDAVTVITKIYGFSGEGTCTLTLSKTGYVDILRSANILYQTEFSTCEGFSINKSQLEPGEWMISATVAVGERQLKQSINFTVE